MRIQDRDGGAVAERFGVAYTPAYLLFDAAGRLVDRPPAAEDALAARLRLLAGP
ncbi:MAG TPA: hypothetical protein VMJ92_02220 [Candidatus Limnocylindrales bacterium]|nr:hypothetical protein [Candidatus Limnocylindrales bacterium]